MFLTHFHSDHVVGLPDFWLTGWLDSPYSRRSSPLPIIGPQGTQELVAGLERAYAADIRIRIADQKLPPDGAKLVAQEFARDGVVYEQGGLKVMAFEVDHGDEIKPAYGYRIDYDGRSVVLSGDTRLSENVIKYGTGTDLLIHEVGAVRPELLADPQVKVIMAHHTSPQEVGTVFSRAQPKLGVYSHLVLLSRGSIPPLTVEELVKQTRETYAGPLQVGEDLMTFEIADGVVKMTNRMPPQARPKN